MMNTVIHTFAFISYNHRDVRWAKWLRCKLEWYRLPAEIHNEFEDSRYIRPVFRDRDELDSGVLGDELRQRLEASKYLIVICSSNSARSVWVSDEVQAFIDMGRLEYIIPFIVDGEPQNYADAEAAVQPLLGECFPQALRTWNTIHPKDSLLGIAVTDDGQTDKQKAFIRVVSRMLGVSFDTLWQRRKREVRMAIGIMSLIASVLLLMAYWFMVPINLTVNLHDERHHLPPIEEGTLLIAGNEYHFHSLDTTISIASLPGYMRNRDIDYVVTTPYRYDTLSLTTRLTIGVAQQLDIQMHRNKDFAIHSGIVLDENSNPIANVNITIENRKATTDEIGRYSIEFPLEEQTEVKQLTASHPDYQTKTIESYTSLCRFILEK